MTQAQKIFEALMGQKGIQTFQKTKSDTSIPDYKHAGIIFKLVGKWQRWRNDFHRQLDQAFVCPCATSSH